MDDIYLLFAYLLKVSIQLFGWASEASDSLLLIRGSGKTHPFWCVCVIGFKRFNIFYEVSHTRSCALNFSRVHKNVILLLPFQNDSSKTRHIAFLYVIYKKLYVLNSIVLFIKINTTDKNCYSTRKLNFLVPIY